MTTLIAETEPGNPYFAFVASIFNDEAVKKEITDQAKIIVVPSARIASEESEATEQKINKNNAETKLADAVDKLSICSAGGDGITGKGSAAKMALREYLEADKKVPHPANKFRDQDIELIKLHDQGTIAARCNDIYELLTGQRL